MATAFGPRYRI